ncbi:MAG: nucleotide sugar dehydrogenase [Ignavibacteria bacterium]|nr:nucleotide sugar dehydrogenase [Ignavibacteria bacterium]MBT8381840.1 nucleotide sugar dehydrogenase [Ignavibacteria bacterium]MBT8392441.1 nucleotide sugar dehydrogenase [Ignavibacteria bacterium]NNJ52895.1 nucleotide sugar dehydrogenase [Ignavibacteriaceae bacterium]NNL19928.1 nucleotide sugar dehydrogenase [Ignavibacteriaceae bacterium]
MADKKFEKNLLCIGAGYVGGPTMAMIAHKCPQYKVTVVDVVKEKIDAWKTDDLPIYEPGLLELVKSAREKNLFFSTDIDKGIKESDIIFISVNTPTKTFGEGAGKSADLQYWEKTARDILRASESDKIIVERSTLPVKTAIAMERILSLNDKGLNFEVVSNPEFLAEGTAIKDLENPDRVLIGSKETESGIKARNEIVEIYANWIHREHLITSNLMSSELSKLVANSFLAQRISSINSISALCEKVDADVEEVANAIGKDTRIGDKFLNASIGFGGSCFKKDILNLVYLCETFGLYEVADYWESVVKINEYQNSRFVNIMNKAMFNTIANKRIALFGFAFKANTSDTRETAALYVTQKLMKERAKVVISDPKALKNAKKDLQSYGSDIEYEEDPYKAAKDSHAIAVMTEWDVYKNLDYEKIYSEMEKPAFIFDGRNILDHQNLFKIGFEVYPIGKTPLAHFKEA